MDMQITLTAEQERQIRNYFRMQDAISVLDCYEIDYTNKSNDELIKLGLAIENAAYDNMGDIEYAILCDYGYIGD